MQKWKKAAINIAMLTMILTTGIINSYPSVVDGDQDLDNQKASKYSQVKKERATEAFEDNDYQAWKEAVGSKSKLSNAVKELDFQNFVAARTAARNGRYEEAIQITERLKKEIESRLS
jgi:hypothetical protein